MAEKMKCLFHTIELFFIYIAHLSFTDFWEEVKNGHSNVASVLGAARSEISRFNKRNCRYDNADVREFDQSFGYFIMMRFHVL